VEVEVYLYVFLTSELEQSASRPGRFTTGERTPGIHWIGNWLGPQSRSGRGGEEKEAPAPAGK